jgi:hypothetical protein
MTTPPEQLKKLLLDTAPTVYHFESRQSYAERAALMATVPADAQRAAKLALPVILAYYLDEMAAAEKEGPRPLIYYMSAELEEEEWRCQSEDWRLAIHANDELCFCDFNGWPGDNESGAGVLWQRDRPDTMTVVYENGDMSLEGVGPFDTRPYKNILRRFEKHRQDEETYSDSEPEDAEPEDKPAANQ